MSGMWLWKSKIWTLILDSVRVEMEADLNEAVGHFSVGILV